MAVTSETPTTRGASRVPVVSIGNLALGGRGKTPTTALVARLLVGAGERPAILSRGYKRTDPVDGVVVVSDGERQLADVGRGGDEPVLLARNVPGAAVLVCDVRAMAAAVAEEHLGSTVHVLDDGFQHRSMRRDVDLVIVRKEDLDDRAVPFGRLRSAPRALRRAHAVIVDGARPEDLGPRLAGLIDPQRTKIFTLVRRLAPLQWLEASTSSPIPAAGSRVVAVAGIAQPRRFADALIGAGYLVSEFIELRDHHAFVPRDLERLRTAWQRTSASAVVTTEKDAMRLLPLRPFHLPVAVAPLEVDVEPAGEFRAWLSAKLAEVRAWA